MVAALESCSVDAGHTPALYAGFLRLLLAAKRGKDEHGENGIKLDPALASKLSADQQPHHPGLSATLAASAPPRHDPLRPDGSISAPAIFAQDLGGLTSRPNGLANGGASAFMSGEPSNQPSGSFWNLDQLGQAGFWENLSMRTLLVTWGLLCRADSSTFQLGWDHRQPTGFPLAIYSKGTPGLSAHPIQLQCRAITLQSSRPHMHRSFLLQICQPCNSLNIQVTCFVAWLYKITSCSNSANLKERRDLRAKQFQYIQSNLHQFQTDLTLLLTIQSNLIEIDIDLTLLLITQLDLFEIDID